MKRSFIIPLLIWTLLWALFLGTIILAVDRLPNSDLSGQFHTFAVFQARELAAGRLPVRSPGSYGGIPFAADTQAALFYLPRWLTVLLTLPDGLSYFALEMEGLLHIWLSGVLVYFLVVDITRDWNSSRGKKYEKNSIISLQAHQWAGLLAAVAFGLGGYLTSYPLLQLAVLETMTWLPLVLLLLRRGVYAQPDNQNKGFKQISYLLSAGGILGLSALAGHPQTFLHVASLAAVYFFFLTWVRRWRVVWTFGIGLLIFIVSLGIALPSFLPAFQFLPSTVRDSISYEALSEGFSILDYIQVLIPGPLSLWLPQYAGLATLFLTFIAVKGRKLWADNKQRSETYFWIGVAVIAAWLSLGDKGILFELTYRIAPTFSLFRQQERLVSLFSLALALLGGQGLALWLRASVDQRRLLVQRSAAILGGLLAVTGLIFLLSRSAQGEHDWLALWLRQWLILAGILFLLWPGRAAQRRLSVTWRCFALILLLFADLFFPLRQAMDLQPEPPTVFWPHPDWLDPLQMVENGRLDSQGLFHANLGELYGIEDIRGISPLKPKLLADYEKLGRPLRWQLLNVQHVLAHEKIEESLTEVATINQSILPGEPAQGFVYRFENALPRAWMVYDVIVRDTPQAAFEFLRGEQFDPAKQVVLTNPDPAILPEISSPKEKPKTIIQNQPGSALQMDVETETPGILVISEWALPGWQVSLDGQPVPLMDANYGLMGLFVPPGKHQINISYGARNVQSGLLLALGTILLALVIGRRFHPTIPLRPAAVEKPTAASKKMKRRLVAIDLSQTKVLWLMVGLLLLGFGLRIFLLGNQELRGDEAFSYLFAQLAIDEVVPELIDQGDPHSPLHYILLNLWVNAAGESELAMRFLSLIPGFLFLPLFFQVGRQMAGRKLGLLATLLASISPLLIWLSQDVRNQYMLALLFTTAATWLLVKVSNPATPFYRRKRLLYWMLYISSSALAVYGHYYALFALLSHGFYLWFAPRRRRFLMSWMIGGILVFLLFLPWLIVAVSELLQAGQLSDPDSPEVTAYLVDIGRELVSGSALRGGSTRWLFLSVLFFVVIGFNKLRAKKPGWAAMLMAWLAGAALMIFLVRFSRSTFNEFYISVAVPAWILLFSAGLLSLWRGRRLQQLAAVAALLSVLVATSFSLNILYFDPQFSRTLGYRQVATQVGERVQEGDVFIAHFPDPALDYYLRDVPLPRQMVPAENNLPDAQVEQNLAQLSEQHDRIWFVPYNNSVWDDENVVPRWLDYHMLHEQEVQTGRLTLQTFRPRRTADDVATPVELSLQNGMNLHSVYLTLDGRPINLDNQPVLLENDALLKVSLLWSTEETLDDNYTVFVHILDENGMLMAQHDGIPLFGTRPTYTWLPGEQLLDRHELIIEQNVTGHGRLIVGLYDTDTLQRQPMTPQQDMLVLADVIIR